MTSSRQQSILVVEDDAALRQSIALLLELQGYRAFTAANGTDGLALATRERPTIVVTDVAMPGLTGFELLEALRRNEATATIPVIVLTAKIEREAMRRAMELGAADFISKPFSEQELLNSITARLEQKALLDELDSFAHTVAHDLRNPLGTLRMRLELLEFKLRETPAAHLGEHVTSAIHSADRLANIIQELMVLTGVRRQTVAVAPIDMGKVVAEVVDRLDQLLQRHEATVEVPPSWPVAVGYAPWVSEIWANYLSNAAKYGGPRPRIVLGAAAANPGYGVRFWVQDFGPGLDDDLKRKMFVPFARIGAARADGHGLGLSIVQRISDKLGGRVGVDSVPGQGACFWFELPAAT